MCGKVWTNSWSQISSADLSNSSVSLFLPALCPLTTPLSPGFWAGGGGQKVQAWVELPCPPFLPCPRDFPVSTPRQAAEWLCSPQSPQPLQQPIASGLPPCPIQVWEWFSVSLSPRTLHAPLVILVNSTHLFFMLHAEPVTCLQLEWWLGPEAPVCAHLSQPVWGGKVLIGTFHSLMGMYPFLVSVTSMEPTSP